MIETLEKSPLLNARIVLLLLLAHIIVIKARRVIYKRALRCPFRSSHGGWVLAPQCAHQTQVDEVAEVLAGQRGDRAVIRLHVELGGAGLVLWHGHQRGHPVLQRVTVSDILLARDAPRFVDGENGHALVVLGRRGSHRCPRRTVLTSPAG